MKRKLFFYIEKILHNINFFNNQDILDEIEDKDSKTRNIKFKEIKEKKMENGDVFAYYLNGKHPAFNFKINTIIYELIFLTDYNDSLIKLNDKIDAYLSEIDPLVAGRYGIVFYPREFGDSSVRREIGNKFGNIKLIKSDSVKLFDYIRTCAEKIDKKKFYFDGAYTKKERAILNKIKFFKEKIRIKEYESTLYNNADDKKIFYKFFLEKIRESDLRLKPKTLEKIKNLIRKTNFKNLGSLINDIIFIIRDDLRLNVNAREEYFISLLKKNNIKYEIGKVSTRTIFFEL